jgi:hypothetical protein
MLYCYLKIAYYVALIIYHCVDIVSDWVEFGYEVYHQGKFAGVSTNSTTIKGILGFSCASGTGCSGVMLIVYGCYICFHCECIQKSTYRLLKNVEFQRDSLLKCSDDNESKTAICNRQFCPLGTGHLKY